MEKAGESWTLMEAAGACVRALGRRHKSTTQLAAFRPATVGQRRGLRSKRRHWLRLQNLRWDYYCSPSSSAIS